MREHKYLPATFNDRIQAFSIDYGSVVLIMLISIFMQFNSEYDPYIKMLITLSAWYIINVVPNFIKPGSSLGKRNSDTIILTEKYTEVTIAKMHQREFFILISSLLTGGIYIVVAFFLLDKRVDKRAIHDIIFKTRVVRKTPFVGKSE